MPAAPHNNHKGRWGLSHAGTHRRLEGGPQLRHVLVTGATGLVGAEVVARLAPRAAVVALVHRQRTVRRSNGRTVPVGGPHHAGFDGPGVTTVDGDVTASDLGLGPAAAHALRQWADVVVHSAALTDFGMPAAAYRRANVDGTANVVQFIEGADRPLELVHVSTAYVCGNQNGTINEADFDRGQTFGNPYEESKFEAEVIVRRLQVRPWVIVRPSIVAGLSRNGAIREFKNLYPALKVLTEGRVRAIPGRYDALLNLVPVDHVAEVTAAAAQNVVSWAGETLHAVGRRPLSLRDFSDVLAEYPPFHVPRFVPPSAFDVANLGRIERAYYEQVVGLYEPYFHRQTSFAVERTASLVGLATPSAGPAFLRRLLDHALRVGYLGYPRTGPAEAVARARTAVSCTS